MANVQKYTRTEIGNGNLTRHYERAKNEKGEYYNFGNQDIDPTKTHLNYNLGPDREVGQLDFIAQRTAELNCLKRADVNVMCSWVVTAPKSLGEHEQKLFFEEAYKFLNQRYAGGDEKNVISAYVHMDENQPHMHYAFVPVALDFKKNIEKVSAKLLVNRSDLQTFHQDLEKHMERVFGREIGILNEATREGNRSIAELKRETAQQKLTEITADVSDLQNKRDLLQGNVNDLRRKSKGLERKLEDLEGDLKTKQRKVKAVENKAKWADGVMNKFFKEHGIGDEEKGEITDDRLRFTSFGSDSSDEIKKRSSKIPLSGKWLVQGDDFDHLLTMNANFDGALVNWLTEEADHNELKAEHSEATKDLERYKQSHDALARLPENERSRILGLHARETARERTAREAAKQQTTLAGRADVAQQRAKQKDHTRQKPEQKTPSQKKSRETGRT